MGEVGRLGSFRYLTAAKSELGALCEQRSQGAQPRVCAATIWEKGVDLEYVTMSMAGGDGGKVP